jgi:hypothetical protein
MRKVMHLSSLSSMVLKLQPLNMVTHSSCPPSQVLAMQLMHIQNPVWDADVMGLCTQLN